MVSKYWKAMLVTVVMACLSGPAGAKGLKYIETADGAQLTGTRNLVQWTHTRLVFNKELERVAVGQDATLELEVLGANEVLALAKQVGRTSIMVWYTDKTTETFLFSVVQDLSVLRRALRDVHRNIRIELAPDRAALVLRGQVPTIKYREAAEAVASDYFEAGKQRGSSGSGIVVQAPDLGSKSIGSNLRVKGDEIIGGRTAAIINLIQVKQLPQALENKIRAAIRHVGGENVKVSRVQTGDLANDSNDSLMLTGHVQNQVALTRVLNVAARMFLGESGDASIKALTDESGSMLDGRSGSSAGGGFGLMSSTSGNLDNEIRANLARSKLISAADGRILSMIDVKDLPQVRVSVQMHEVDRLRLKSWRPDMTLKSQGYDSGGAFSLNGLEQKSVNADTVENALQLIGGALTNNVQIASGSFAFDMLFSILEEEGISRTLSRPTLTVLAGESAVFRAGGEVPVPNSFAPTGSNSADDVTGNLSGVFSGTEFKSFGVELSVRAMVDENDKITLDINPTVSLPDTALTQQIAGSTGSRLNTAAFDVRSINTSTRVADGQPLVIGGLVTRDISNTEAFTPGLNKVPLVGKLAESSGKSDSDKELIIVVTPTIIREPKHNAQLWHYPSARDLLGWAVAMPKVKLQNEKPSPRRSKR